MSRFQEPPFNPLDDTNPSLTIRPVELTQNKPAPLRKALGLLSLAGAVLFTMGTIAVVMLPSGNSNPDVAPPAVDNSGEIAPEIGDPAQIAAETVVETAIPDAQPEAPQNNPDVQLVQAPGISALATIDPERLASLLETPIAPVGSINRPQIEPFTIISDRPRTEFTEYTVVSGDTIDAISRRYGLRAESLAWCNDRRIIFVLRPGDVLAIPPVDGACHQVLGTRQLTIEQIAEQYNISNAFELIDSPFNNLNGRSPGDVLPGGSNLFLPGGEGELITWNPGTTVERNNDGTVRTVAFASGQAGSCGAVEPGGGAAWGNPLPNGTWVRGYFAGHTGIDISAAVGTPIFAANSGPVLFSGFSRWGYGETVVLGHGPFSTLYAHMSSRSVGCGGYVSVGQVVGTVGSTGNSSGPHLHFEIRYNDTPQDPSATAGIGW